MTLNRDNMKKVLFLLTLLPMFCFGQNETKDLEFMKIPIEGTVAEFRDALIEKHGFTYVGKDNESVHMEGDFWKFEDIKVDLIGKENDPIHRIRIILRKYVWKEEIVQFINRMNELYFPCKITKESLWNSYKWVLNNGFINVIEWTKISQDEVLIFYEDMTMLKKEKEKIAEEDKDLI